jgi:(p)ppGpp synthase/HD superfamily hydrolase
MFTVEDAIKLAAEAHKGQVDKTGADYIDHPVSVSGLVSLLPSFHELSDEDRRTAVLTAVLHDVLEDTTETVESLLSAGVPENVVRIVQILTKNRKEDLGTYHNRVVADPIARCVKTADLLHNNLPQRKKGLTDTTAIRLGLKYGVAIPRIVSKTDENVFYSIVEEGAEK